MFLLLEMMPFLPFIILGIVLLISLYNGIIKNENKVKQSFASIDVNLKKRYDLIPNLVNCVKGYMKYETEVMESITKLRNQDLSLRQTLDENEKIVNNLNQFYMSIESYPELKANELFLELTDNLIAIENELSAARRLYNSTVLKYNNSIMTFPGNVFAIFMRKKPYKMYEAELNAKENIKINL